MGKKDLPGFSWTLLDFRGFSPGLNQDATTTQPRRKHDAPGRNLDGGAGVMELWGNGAVMGAEPPAPPVTGEGVGLDAENRRWGRDS